MTSKVYTYTVLLSQHDMVFLRLQMESTLSLMCQWKWNLKKGSHKSRGQYVRWPYTIVGERERERER